MIFYLFGIKILYGLIKVVSLFNEKADFWIKGRKGLLVRLKKDIQKNEKIAWFHCASLGEFEQGRPVIEEFKNRYKDFKILLTFYSPSGYEIRKNYEGADYIYYLPIDTPRNAKRFLEIVNPKVAFFVKYEFWHYFIKETSKRDIPLYLISGIFRREQRFFKWYGGKARKMLRSFSHFFVQNLESKQLLESINISNVTVSGDTRFDRVSAIADMSKELPLIEKYKNNQLTLVAGSTWRPDEEIIIRHFNQNKNIKLIIAPHEIHKDNIARIVKAFSDDINVLLYSDANQENIAQADVVIINSIGLLSSLYKYADLAYIGGGFGKGIHNTLEAATFGMPILFGPNYLKFKEAVDLIRLKGAISISDYDEYNKNVTSIISNNSLLETMSKCSTKYVKENKGATQIIIDLTKL